MATKPNTEHKEPKTVALQTHVLSLALTFVFTLMVGTACGWFVHVTMESEARQNVVHDMQLVKDQK